MTICDECGFDWDLTPVEALALISTIASRFRDALAPLTDQTIRLRPEPQVWAPLEYLAHLRDVVEFYDQRVHRILTEERPVLSVDMTFAEVAEIRHYRSEDPAAVHDALAANTSKLHGRLAALTEAQWVRAGIGSSGEERTVLALARRAGHEAHHHLLDIVRD